MIRKLIAVTALCWALPLYAAQPVVVGEVLATKCDIEGDKLVNCVAVLIVDGGPKSISVDGDYSDLVGEKAVVQFGSGSNKLVPAIAL
jgi:hypothetical protein